MAKSKQIGMVLQGGGALGAFEYGVVTELVAQGYEPVAVSGVSIGAINSAAIAGAKHGDIAASLQRVWKPSRCPRCPGCRVRSRAIFRCWATRSSGARAPTT